MIMSTVVDNAYATISEAKDGSVAITAKPSSKAWWVVYGEHLLSLDYLWKRYFAFIATDA